jgi:excisionase family DNA binding protein
MTTGKEKLQQLHALIDEHVEAERRMLRAFAEFLVETTGLIGGLTLTPSQVSQSATRDDEIHKRLTMNTKEFAKRVGVSRATISRFLRDGDVSCVRLGGRVLFTEEHAVELLKKFEAKAIVRKQRPIKIT